MIEYVEIRGENRKVIGIIDTAFSVIWHSLFFSVGDFEVHAAASPDIVALLQAGYYVTRPDNDFVGIIENIYISEDADKGAVITASGRFAKSMLARRVIYNLSGKTNKATILRGNVETAVRAVVKSNAIDCPFDRRRNISVLALGASAGLPLQIVDENGNAAQKQVTHENLLEYTDGVLAEYGLAAKCPLQDEMFLYTVYGGADRSVDNIEGNAPVIFSKEFDNLTSSEYEYSETAYINVALIGGEGEGVDRFYTLLAKQESGLQRREIWIDAASIKKTLKASEIQEMFPSGVFSGVNFNVGGTTFATLVFADAEREYTLAALQESFPAGTTSGTKFIVGGVTYANKVYGDDENYTLTPIGYKAMLDVEEKEGDYLLTDAVYTTLLKTKGIQDIAPRAITETFDGTLDGTNGNYVYGRDFALGDIVTVQDHNVGRYVNVRIREALEVQDEDGYSVEVKYQ